MIYVTLVHEWLINLALVWSKQEVMVVGEREGRRWRKGGRKVVSAQQSGKMCKQKHKIVQ